MYSYRVDLFQSALQCIKTALQSVAMDVLSVYGEQVKNTVSWGIIRIYDFKGKMEGFCEDERL